MKIQDREIMYKRIEQHGENLNKIFNTQVENVTLCKRLRTLENKLYSIALDFCNGHIQTDQIEKLSAPLMKRVYKLLNNGEYKEDRPHQRGVPIFFNTDARGYALKINDDYVRLLRKRDKTIYTDFGGYGILAPDFTPSN